MGCLLAGLPPSRDALVDIDLRLDVGWFRCLGRKGNMIHLLSSPVGPIWVIECDSCLTGSGAFTTSCCFTGVYSPAFMVAFPALHELEAINLLIAVRHLVLTNSVGIVMLVNTENAASAAALSSGRAVDPMGLCQGAVAPRFALEIRHKPGTLLQFVDDLSHAHASPQPLTLSVRSAHPDPCRGSG